MKIAVAQLGARMHYAVPRIFHEAEMLEHLFTDAYVGNKPWLEAVLRALPRRARPKAIDRWLARKEPTIPREKITSFDLLGLRHIFAQNRARNGRELSNVFADHGRAFNQIIVRHGLGAADTVWGFNGAALELFQWAKTHGLKCILEQTIAPKRVCARLVQKETERWLGWQPESEPVDDDPLIQREEAEWELADLIVCGSQFVVDGIKECGGPVAQCRVVPYGVDTSVFGHVRRGRPGDGGKLRVLFAGEVGLRKGAPYLLEALRFAGPQKVEARFAGGLALAPEKLASYRDVATFLGPVPRAQMPELYAWADVLVLPAVCEGSATVTYEAVAAGRPVICSRAAGALLGSAIRVLSELSVGDLKTALEEAHRSRSSFTCDSSPYDLHAYASRLLEAVRELL